MKAVLLAAGYATRLYPMTKNMPKSLLPVGGQAIIGHILDKISEVAAIDEVYIVTNDRFYHQFADWLTENPQDNVVHVLNDGTSSNETRLGALGDLQLTLDHYGVDEDVMVLAGDNLFDFSLEDFVAFFRDKQADCITAHVLDDRRRLQTSGIITVDEEQRVLTFDEKPVEPRSNLAVPPFYLYRQATLPLLRQYLEAGENPDAPGHFIPWLIERRPVYAYIFAGERYDIGTPESFAEAQAIFSRSDQSS